MAPLYARYVPPKPASNTDSNTNTGIQAIGKLDVNQAPNSLVDGQTSDGRKKRKRSDTEEAERKARKAQRRREKDGDAPANSDAVDASTVSDVDVATNGTREDKDHSKKQKRRQRKERNSDTPNPTGSEEEDVSGDESTLTKHGSVLSKYQKATKRSNALQVSKADDEETEHKEAPVLHGTTTQND